MNVVLTWIRMKHKSLSKLGQSAWSNTDLTDWSPGVITIFRWYLHVHIFILFKRCSQSVLNKHIFHTHHCPPIYFHPHTRHSTPHTHSSYPTRHTLHCHHTTKYAHHAVFYQHRGEEALQIEASSRANWNNRERFANQRNSSPASAPWRQTDFIGVDWFVS